VLDDLDTIDWHSIHHAYGTANDIPDLLRQLTTSSRNGALGSLWGNIYHQGTRWEASEYAVPFLYELATAETLSDRDCFISLLLGLAIGDTDSEKLPFDPDAAFSDASLIDDRDAEYVREQVGRFYNEEDVDATLLDNIAVFWARNAYRAVELQTPELIPVLNSANINESIAAVHLLVWFPATAHKLVPAICAACSPHRPDFNANAHIVLGYMANYDCHDAIVAQLRRRLTSSNLAERATSGIGLVLACGESVEPGVLDPLIEMAGYQESQDTIISNFPWWRPLRGFAHHALHLLGTSLT
jgi:hypothetical protein